MSVFFCLYDVVLLNIIYESPLSNIKDNHSINEIVNQNVEGPYSYHEMFKSLKHALGSKYQN